MNLICCLFTLIVTVLLPAGGFIFLLDHEEGYTKQGVLYLSVIRDLFDNSIVAYKTSTTQNVQLVLETIKAAKKKEKVTGELQLHS
ncbi:MAG: hypothetical protein IIW34_07525, partial [Clostridia bacterium]|nr:hypothetical protein [Clostridia bacterium]